MAQNYTSKDTSINKNKTPMVYSNKFAIETMRDKKIIDIGGGKYDNAVEKAKEYNATVNVYDPYNRSTEHNIKVISDNYNVAVISNVLNVIDDKESRLNVVRLASNKANTILITVYEGNKSGIGKVSKKDCWQENRVTEDYISEIIEALPNWNVTRKGKVIKAEVA